LSIHLERSTWSESKKFGSSRESLILEKDTWNSIRTEALRERERLEYSRDKLGRSVERERLEYSRDELGRARNSGTGLRGDSRDS